MPAPVVHFEIGFRDLAKAQSFYGSVFGWEFAPGGPHMAMITNLGHGESGGGGGGGSIGIGGHLSAMGHEPHTYVTVYAMVDDIEATLAKITGLGGKTIVPKTEVPGMGHFAWFSDPQGNTLGLWTSMTK
ncbi:MAG: VOC family protein [Phycisphaeraceae bacterium]|nr:MAG: VOC family protein [Phycisphaeraceae bacterium]